MNPLAASIRHQFIRINEHVHDEGGYDGYSRCWTVDFVFGTNFIQSVSHDDLGTAERVADRYALMLANMIHALRPGNLPIESPHFDIAAERRRQALKGYTPAHDDTHKEGELAAAAACYALPLHDRIEDFVERIWPFDNNPPDNDLSQRYDQLAAAGALIVAEMSRLNRQKL